MANIRITCPTCRTELEIDDSHVGGQVECGNCLQVFVAEPPRRERADAPGGPAGRGRDDDRDDDRPRRDGRSRRDDERDDRDDRPRRRRRDDDRDDDRPRRRRRRDPDDDFDDYGVPRRADGGSDGLAIASLVTGIIALVASCCWPVGLGLGVVAVVTGSMGMKSRESNGLAVAGLVTGIIALCISGVLLLFGLSNAAGPVWFR
jgi:predicted Zn finger-like uncharacterized protein